ncbi:MAG: SPFH domain-containing protein [Sedimentisphaerales bacterium]
MIVSSKRPKNVAIFSFVVSVLFFSTSLLIGQWRNFFAISAAGWFFLYTALIWFVLSIQFYQRALAEQEKLDLGQLAGNEQGSSIFQAKSERENLFSVAQGRLKILEKWFIPIFGGIIAAYQVIGGLFILNAALSPAEGNPTDPLFCSIVMASIAFISFLLSRYATGMSSQKEWKPLRAGGSSMLGASLLSFALAIVLALVHLFPSLNYVLEIIAKIIPVLMIVLGLEIALNLVMDIYRPRLRGQYSRSAFDSRLLGIINEPGGILKSAADALDYQFGFKVSQTWFYKLLEQAIVPLILFGALTLYALSAIVVVGPDEQAVIERFGNPLNDANEPRIIGSGLKLKWPWPIDKAQIYPVSKISEISIGYVEDEAERAEKRPKLWGVKHYKEEYQLLVASEQQEEDTTETTVPVSVVIAAVPVQYRVNNIYSFLYNHDNPEELLKSICYRELTKYAVSAKLEMSDESESQLSLLGRGRIEASKILTERIQKDADEKGLGVEIVFLGLQGVHPPVEVAADYENVTGAIQEKQRMILDAQARSIETLSASAGSVEEARELYDLDKKVRVNESQKDPNEADMKKLDDAFEQAKGSTYKTLAEAQTYAFKKEVDAEATGKRFADQLKAYHAAPDIYLYEQLMTSLEQTLKDIRKYVIIGDKNDKQINIINLENKLENTMTDIEDAIRRSREQ